MCTTEKIDLKRVPCTGPVKHCHEDCVEFLLKSGAKVYDDLLWITGRKGSERCVNLILEAGGDPSQILFGAVRKGRENVVDLLIKAGADVNYREDEPVLFYAVRRGSVQCLDLLLNSGADVNVTDDQGETVLFQGTYFTCNTRLLNGIKKMLQEEIKVNGTSHDGFNALTYFLKKISERREEGNQLEELVMLLFAAGETVDKSKVETVPDYLKPSGEICLKNISRESIRKHLLQLSDVNLFARIPKLELPQLMTSYLLYDVSLDHDEEQSEDNNDSDND